MYMRVQSSITFRLLSPLLAAGASRSRPPLRVASRACRSAVAASVAVPLPPPESPPAPPPPSPGRQHRQGTLPPPPPFAYASLARSLAAVEAEPARLGKEALMRRLLDEAWGGEEQLLACVALTTLQLAPGGRPVKLGLGKALLLDAIAHAAARHRPDTAPEEHGGRAQYGGGARPEALAARLKELGDIGARV